MEKNYVTVLLDNNPSLREKSQPVDLPLSVENRSLLQSLLDYVIDSHDEDFVEQYELKAASGLAAPQIGINKQLFAIYVEEEKEDDIIIHRYALANPKIISHSEQQAYLKSGEGCLSVEDKHEGYVPRSARIRLSAYDMLLDKEITIRASGYLAIVLQHELDHLKGILFYDHIDPDHPFSEIPNALVID